MKKKQPASVRREKSVASCTTKPKKEKVKGQCMSDVYDSMSGYEEMEHCGRGRKKKNSFTLCTPSTDNRCQLALQSGSHPHVSKNKFDRSKSSSRSFDRGSPMKSGCTSPVQSKSDSKGLSLPYNSSYSWNITRPTTTYHGDDQGVSAYASMLQRQQSYMKSGDYEGEMSNAFSVSGSKPWTYTSAKSIASSTQSKYAPPACTRSLAAIMADYAQPQIKKDNITESLFNTSLNDVTSKNQNYMSKNFTHNSSSYLSKPTSLQLSDSKSSPSFRFSAPRPRSANAYHTGSTKFADYRDDMSTITFNAVRNDSVGRVGLTNLSSKPSSERKSLASKFGLSDNTFGSDNIESILKSGRPSASTTKSSYYDTSSTSQQGVTSYRRKYDSSLCTTSNGLRHDYLPNRSNIGGISHDYDFRTRLFDTSSSDSFANKAMSSFAYDDYENRIPLSKNFSGFIGNHWQSEKDRLNKIANIIGKSTYGSSKKE